MPGPILPISSPTLPDLVRPAGAPSGGSAFQDAFSSAIGKVESLGKNASASVEKFLSGDGEDLHKTALAITQSELAFEMFLQTRNKVVSAYQEVMRMQM